MSATFPVQVDTARALAAATLAGASLTPVSGALYLVAVANVHAAVGTPTLSGTGGFNVTWTQVATKADAGAAERLTVFRGAASSGSAGALTADFGGVSQTIALMVTYHCPTVDQGANQGVVQSASATQAASSAPTVTFAAFGAVFNVAVMFSMTSLSATWTNSTSGWSATPVVSGAGGSLGGMFRAHATLDTAPVGTFGSSGVTCSVGVELKVDAALAGPGDALRGTTPLADAARRTGFGGPVRGVQVADGSEFLPGGPGPGGYIVNDPAGLGAVAAPQVGTPFGLWPSKSQRDDAVGNTAPSQVQRGVGVLKGVLVPVTAGARTVSLDALLDRDPGASLRPQMVLKANPDVGLLSDVTVTATGSLSWQTLTASFTATADGVVEVWRVKRDRDISSVHWDNEDVS